MKKFLLFLLLPCLLAACLGENPKFKTYSLQQLEANNENSLQLASEENPDIYRLVQKLSEMDRSSIEKLLQKKGLNIFEASYGFHFLGNRYFTENQFEKGMFYQQLSADQYMNPYAMLRLSLIFSKSREEIQSSLPEGQAANFQQDYSKSFYYLHRAINAGILTMEYFKDRTVLDDINRFGSPLIELYERKDSVILSKFDIQKAEKKAAENLAEIEKAFLKVYNPTLKTN
jgi:hypothetical protein